VETYWNLKEIEKKNQRFKVCVEMTISYFNQERAMEIYDYFINELKVYNVFVRLVRGNPRDPIAKEVDINKYERFSKKLEEDIRNKVFYGHAVYPLSEFITARDILGRRLTIKLVKENRYQIPCYAGSLTGVLRNNGDIYPCELLDKKIGNLRDYGYRFKDLWRSRKAEEIRHWIRKSKCFCTHECFLTNNILFNPKMLPLILKEYIKLKLR
jgi:radical SAM protein with 4Fe4S-binding SPASM domain